MENLSLTCPIYMLAPMAQSERLYRLNQIAIYQMKSLLQSSTRSIQRLKELNSSISAKPKKFK